MQERATAAPPPLPSQPLRVYGHFLCGTHKHYRLSFQPHLSLITHPAKQPETPVKSALPRTSLPIPLTSPRPYPCCKTPASLQTQKVVKNTYSRRNSQGAHTDSLQSPSPSPTPHLPTPHGTTTDFFHYLCLRIQALTGSTP